MVFFRPQMQALQKPGSGAALQAAKQEQQGVRTHAYAQQA
jgi:hypothetical protein